MNINLLTWCLQNINISLVHMYVGCIMYQQITLATILTYKCYYTQRNTTDSRKCSLPFMERPTIFCSIKKMKRTNECEGQDHNIMATTLIELCDRNLKGMYE